MHSVCNRLIQNIQLTNSTNLVRFITQCGIQRKTTLGGIKLFCSDHFEIYKCMIVSRKKTNFQIMPSNIMKASAAVNRTNVCEHYWALFA